MTLQIPHKLLEIRQRKFIELMETGSAALFLAAPTLHRNSDVEYNFRQDSSFWYLTSFNEPESALLIIKTKTETKKVFFCRVREKEKEIWTGYRAGLDGAKHITGIDEVYEFKSLEDYLEKYLLGISHFHFDTTTPNSHSFLRNKIAEIARNKRIQRYTNTQNLVAEMRLFKDDYEISLMREAAQISAQAHLLAMKEAKAGAAEYVIEGKIQGYFREHNADWAYPSIVAGGNNATILHYVNNNQKLEKGKLLLIDAGCERDYYASDITRTFPVESKYNSAQKDIYELVLKAQKACIERCALATKEENISFDSIHDLAVKILSQGLIELKLLSGTLEEVIEKKAFRKFYMHRTGHWLGLDVHDLGSYIEPHTDGLSRILRPGMVTTVEPGLYFDPEDSSIPKDFRGIGVRIEDDVLITNNGIEVLTKDIPKEVSEIESIIGV